MNSNQDQYGIELEPYFEHGVAKLRYKKPNMKDTKYDEVLATHRLLLKSD